MNKTYKMVFWGKYKIYTGQKKPDRKAKLHSRYLVIPLLALLYTFPCFSKTSTGLIEFETSAGDLATSLLQFSEQSGIQVFYRSQSSQGITVKAVKGSYTIEQFLDKLLAGSGLTYQYADNNTITVLPVKSKKTPDKPALLKDKTPGFGKEDKIEEILVTGSHLPRHSKFYSSSPITLITQDELATQGKIFAAEIVRNLTINTGAEFQLDALSSTETVGTSNINLRGLGLGSTLVLLNNHRQTASALATQDDGSSFVDLNSMVPLIMIERIEVLKDGASAIYGTDAVAGVVNFITYKDFEGIKVQGNYQTVTEGSHADTSVSVMYGKKLSRTQFVAAGSYLNRKPLKSTDRDFTRGSAISSLGQPGTFLTSSGFVADPMCSANGGLVLDNGFCGLDITPFFELSPNEEAINLSANLSHQFNNNNKAYLEVGYVKNDGETIATPSFPFAKFNPIVPAANPGNLFGEDVTFFGRVLGSNAQPSSISYEHDTLRVSAELSGGFTSKWEWSVSADHSRNKVRDERNDTLADRLLAALSGNGGPDNNEFFNPFGGAANSASVISDIIAPAIISARSSLTTAGALMSGELLSLATGQVNAAIGTQFRHEKLDVDLNDFKNADRFLSVPGGDDFSVSRNVGAVFAELNVPVYDQLDITVAARYENYGKGLDSIDPMLTVTWYPGNMLSLRASFGTSFRTPSPLQTGGSSGSNRIISDPLLGVSNTFRTVTTLGNEDLQAEEASVYNLGLTFNPGNDIRFDVNYWHYNYTDVVTKETPQDLIDQAFRDTRAGLTGTSAQQKVIRDPITNAIVTLTTDFINAASIATDGFDMSASYQFKSRSYGRFSIHTDWTYINKYKIRQTPGGNSINAVGSRNFTNFARTVIDWRGNASLSWQIGHHKTGLSLHYIGAYQDDENSNADIRSQTTLDWQYVYSLGSKSGRHKTDVILGIRNVADRAPPPVQTNLGFDTRTHDPRGRMFYLTLSHSLD